MSIVEAQNQVIAAKSDLKRAEKNLKLSRKQARCKHKRVDEPGSYFGETCLDCKLYLNNGA